MTYAIMNLEDNTRSEAHLPGARTDRGVRIKAKKYAKENNINNYAIIFYRPSDGCRGEIDI